MITLNIGDTVMLYTTRATFTVTGVDLYTYNGFVSEPWVFIKVDVIMYKSSGTVFRTSDNLFYDTYRTIELPVGKTIVCDCGGFKTYNSMADHYHAHWCMINRGV